MTLPVATTALRRQHRRHVFRAVCVASSQRDGRIVGDRTLDVSYAGMRIAAIDDACVGEKLDLAFEIPGTRLWMTASGRIERVLPGRRGGDEGRALGVRIERMNGFDRVMLATIISAMPEAPSSRGGQRDYAETIARIHDES